jgi:hypothetical protein
MRCVTSAQSLQVSAHILLRATTPGCVGECLRHRDGRAVISPLDKSSSVLDIQDATWIVRPGLAGDSGISLESKNYANSYLRHQNGELYLHPNDRSDQFAADATFTVHPGANGQGVSLAAVNFPSRFVRHYAGEVFLAAEGGPEGWASETSWRDDVSWLPAPAWSP